MLKDRVGQEGRTGREKCFYLPWMPMWKERVPLPIAKLHMSLERGDVVWYYSRSLVRGSTSWGRGFFIGRYMDNVPYSRGDVASKSCYKPVVYLSYFTHHWDLWPLILKDGWRMDFITFCWLGAGICISQIWKSLLISSSGSISPTRNLQSVPMALSPALPLLTLGRFWLLKKTSLSISLSKFGNRQIVDRVLFKEDILHYFPSTEW